MESIRSEIQAGFEAIHRRIDDKHEAVMDRLDAMVTSHDATVKTVHQHSGVLETIQREMQNMRDRWHSRFNALQTSIGLKPKDGELAPLTRLDAKTAVAIYVCGMATLMALMKLLGRV